MTRHPEHNSSLSQIPLIDYSASETERINRESDHQHSQKSKSPQWFHFLPLRRLLFRVRYSRLRDYTPKGTNIVHKAESLIDLNKVPLPLLDKKADSGQEWIKGVLLCAWGCSAILALNVILAIIAIGLAYTRPPDSDKHFEYAELYRGKCSITSGWATGMHLLINVLSTALLAASNYSMQCLSAPSREDIDRAHSQRTWLDIGVFSTRNLWAMDVKRKILWTVLLISSMPIHIMYNSTIFSSITTRYRGVVATPDSPGMSELLTKSKVETDAFMESVGYGPEDVHAEYQNGTLRRENDVSECLKAYDVEYNTKKGTLLLVVPTEHISGSPIAGTLHRGVGFQLDLGESSYCGNLNNLTYPGWSFRAPGNSTWLQLGDFFAEHMYPNYDPYESETLYSDIICTNPGESQLRDMVKNPINPWVKNVAFRSNGPGKRNTLGREMRHEYMQPDQLTINKCFSKDLKEQCQFYFSLPISLIVIGCNIAKVICMYMTARCDRKSILLTLGDGLSSFLHKPDVTTKGRCLMSKLDMTTGKLPWRQGSYISDTLDTTPLGEMRNSPSFQLRRYPRNLPRRTRWFRSPGWKPWTLTLIFFLACLGTTIHLYRLSGANSRVWWKEMGKPTGDTIFFYGKNVILLILLVNSPQLVYSILYFLCNGLLTNMRLAVEFNEFATNRKPLRVSWPKGQQRSAYYISLPYRYGFPLIAVSITMHWLLSQSLFLVKINTINVHGNQLEGSTAGCSHAPNAIFFALLIGSLAMGVLFGLGFRRLPSDMPLASSCSAAISAACHPPPEDTEASLKPVKWGETINGPGISSGNEESSEHMSEDGPAEGTPIKYAHCSFTSQQVMRASPNVLYC